MKLHHQHKIFTLTALAAALLSACNSDSTNFDKPAVPQGLGYEQSVSVPLINGTPVVDGDIPVTNAKGNVVAYHAGVNPILQILAGFDDIWTLGDTTWASTGSDSLSIATGYETYTGISGGATNSTSRALLVDFGAEQTLDQDIWQYNFDYVKTLTRPGQSAPDVDRTDAATQVFAYLDDQREKGYSLTSGLGALADDYRSGANSVSNYAYSADGTEVSVGGTTIDIFDESRLMNDGLGNGTNYGELGYELDDMVTLLNLVRDFGASTEAPKYHFESPRPWRIESDYSVASFSDINDVTQLTCYNLDGSADTKFYDFPVNPLVSPIPGLRCAGRTVYTDNGDGSFSSNYTAGSGDAWVSGRAKDGGFPSGHTTEAVDRGLAFAYAIPARFAEMTARAVDLGTNRIVAGMHSPLDVIGGRIMGTAVTAAALNARPDLASAALTQANSYFAQKAQEAGFNSIYEFAHSATSDPEAQRYTDHDAMKARYRAALTYGFPALDETSVAPQVPKGAEVLLATRFPYLSDAQRRAVLATTEIDSNYPVINQSRGWGRLDLVMAADGYGAFNGDVTVLMDAADEGFSAQDTWRNDISGNGLLTKQGSGSLTLQGNNSFSGGVVLQSGELIAASSSATGTGTLYQQDGVLSVSIDAGNSDAAAGSLNVSDFVQDGGTLVLNLVNNAQVQADKTIYLSGAELQLTVPALSAATTYPLLSADHLQGQFDNVTVSDANGGSYTAQLMYSETGLSVTVIPAV
ncbi:phosphatase PAP2 family protein [Vibrio sp. ABG19]|uniref:phosphatase PAP2 family protein n=1 Tax=Vibrio sp. ABG19 TaxID=2817385 RepID=UPI00249EC6B6|nr:phosphatase PAP2 family protein [Vibrio sp. ABG19]WGY47125.1 phosphatase PAP2 family protein [Vibrio sp. ABG19]